MSCGPLSASKTSLILKSSRTPRAGGWERQVNGWQRGAAQWLGVRLLSAPGAALGCMGLALCLAYNQLQVPVGGGPWRQLVVVTCRDLLEGPLVGPGMW